MVIDDIDTFLEHLIVGKPILGIDYGTSYIGVAISSLNHNIAMPLKLLQCNKKQLQLKSILSIISEHKICAIVMGMPINKDASRSNQTNITVEFTKNLVEKTDVPIFMQDERYTSITANKLMFPDTIKQKSSSKKKSSYKKNDAIAAAIILETILAIKKIRQK
ncbi:Holliday junction resolvase RuvX [Rickettsia endosymbiont of Cardiosporidium cionae]|uniref:Holliday junction resolvase RuvX n=1 Tax=Rickettsia endosymbiont of Cardiosporidium cionae TaxID=2777155 RepID=UPI0018946162|nr:Holliday junction resolvase RuvX [Rickettsia endosymbiont of Cardiosporidium cionae]KAF8818134.1 Holliday junction resolvase RuvX [Rickettsia endosymbiont of Cardiosporidium cionae]